jgi:acetyltransferase-like isoleucine patch superfamily enzyme
MTKIYKKILKALVRITPVLVIRINLLRLAGYRIGKGVYIPSDILISDLKTRKDNIIIGDRVSIGPRVTLITDSSPNNSKLLKKFPLISGKIVIEEDSWIGASTVILPNVTIGKCSIVASGSICNKDVSSYTIVGGVPAKFIRKIDEIEI